MADIFEFPNENEHEYEDEACDCEACMTTEDYLEIARECKSDDELRSVLRGLYEDAFQAGYNEMLEDDIMVKQDLLEKRYSEELDY